MFEEIRSTPSIKSKKGLRFAAFSTRHIVYDWDCEMVRSPKVQEDKGMDSTILL